MKGGLSAVLILLISISSMILIAGCSRQQNSKVLNVSGSSTVLPVVTAAAEEYQKRNPGIKVGVQGGGSSAGIEAAITGASDIGTSSRDLKDAELSAGLVDTIIAIDAIAIIVNPSNPVTKLSKQQAKDIYMGKITNWKEVGGKDMEIVLVNRDEASGTRDAFLSKVLDKQPFSKNAVIQPGTGQVRSIVGSTDAAIGYISLGYATKDVKLIRFEGVMPTKANVINGTYKLQRKLHFFTKGEPKGEALKFTNFILGDWVQGKVVSREFVPAPKILKKAK
jgi:phosphate transport system substrate-binding protein